MAQLFKNVNLILKIIYEHNFHRMSTSTQQKFRLGTVWGQTVGRPLALP